MNSPATKPSSVRGPHLDRGDEIYAGLLYLRDAKDKITKGGALQVYKCLQTTCPRIRRRANANTAHTQYDPSQIQVTDSVKYEANTFVMFINGEKAIHAVTPRNKTPYSRRLVNIIAQDKHRSEMQSEINTIMRQRASEARREARAKQRERARRGSNKNRQKIAAGPVVKQDDV
mmetsp:Transcript_41736/g.50614  ORF Transcript_41736/g.50614 Transcript_41736/m.50614 type:complete len:174 (+) Transcript_41736:2-523(+)